MDKEDVLKLYSMFKADMAAMEQCINEKVDGRHDAAMIRLNDLYGAYDDLSTEAAAANVQLDRHKDWISQTALQVGVPYRHAA
ncbi:hypothetical protein [Actinomyces bowdenii]|uniref:Uncharacterized protein n=1 Tax=Actinomyces bowdenii TaxID=131109 RepID=A0A3P1UQF4_9ACTO|nr:hypothetical protein [Actinomyces bowdenii]RRD23356.1 hypothetical protein EII10_12030 [Actinomyces bowdenii]